MTIKRSGRRKIRGREPDELTARIIAFRENYFLSRFGQGEDSLVDDEATLLLDAVIERISSRHETHRGETIAVGLLHAQRYPARPEQDSGFFGSVTLRGQSRTALAYLPKEPFWALPFLIDRGASVIQLRFSFLSRGHADLLSIFFGRSEDLEP